MADPRVMSLPAAATAGCDPEPRPLARLTADMKRMRDEAWSEFHQRYFSRLFRYAITLHHGDRASAEDSVQAGYLRAVRHIRRFDDEDKFWSWLTLLVRCAAVDQGRKIAARSRLLDRLLREVHPPHATEPKSNDLRVILLEEALNELDRKDRSLLEEKYTDGDTVAQLAERHDRSTKAIECRLRRLRRKLKSRIHVLTRQTLA